MRGGMGHFRYCRCRYTMCKYHVNPTGFSCIGSSQGAQVTAIPSPGCEATPVGKNEGVTTPGTMIIGTILNSEKYGGNSRVPQGSRVIHAVTSWPTRRSRQHSLNIILED